MAAPLPTPWATRRPATRRRHQEPRERLRIDGAGPPPGALLRLDPLTAEMLEAFGWRPLGEPKEEPRGDGGASPERRQAWAGRPRLGCPARTGLCSVFVLPQALLPTYRSTPCRMTCRSCRTRPWTWSTPAGGWNCAAPASGPPASRTSCNIRSGPPDGGRSGASSPLKSLGDLAAAARQAPWGVLRQHRRRRGRPHRHAGLRGGAGAAGDGARALPRPPAPEVVVPMLPMPPPRPGPAAQPSHPQPCSTETLPGPADGGWPRA